MVQAIPTYTIGVFRLPKALCSKLNSMMAQFWWGSKPNERSLSWMKWEKMGRSKFRGGMGFRDLETFNLGLLANQGWRFLHASDSLVSRSMKEKYYPNKSFMQARLGSRPSYAWRNIFQAWEVLEKGLVWRVGNGEQIHIWGDKWLPTPSTFAIQYPIRVFPSSAWLVDLIDRDSGWWNVDLIRTIFNPGEAEVLYGLVLSPLKQSDKLVWNETTSSLFTVKSAYHLAQQSKDQGTGECPITSKSCSFLEKDLVSAYACCREELHLEGMP